MDSTYAEALAHETFHQTIKMVLGLWPGHLSRTEVDSIAYALQAKYGDAQRQANHAVVTAKNNLQTP